MILEAVVEWLHTDVGAPAAREHLLCGERTGVAQDRESEPKKSELGTCKNGVS